MNEYLRTFAGREGVLGAIGVYRAAFTSIEQTEPLAGLPERTVKTAVIALRRKRISTVTGADDGQASGARSGGRNDPRLRAFPAPEERPEEVVRCIEAIAAKVTKPTTNKQRGTIPHV